LRTGELKVLHINSSDSSGGAARACIDINNALNQIGVDSKVLVQVKHSQHEKVSSINNNPFEKFKTLIRRLADYLLLKIFTVEDRGRFTIPYFGKDISKLRIVKNADIINIHWVNEGFISLAVLKEIAGLRKPIVWTFHDMWAFTGGCHYSLGCRKFEQECFNCPSLKLNSKRDLSNRIFNDKIKLFRDLNFNIVTCSNWLASEVKKSQLLKDRNIEVIPNTLKTEVYKPLDKTVVFQELGLDMNKKYILFGTMTLKDKRKGIELFIDCINLLFKRDSYFRENVKLLILGSEKKMKKIKLPIETIYLGRLNSETDVAKFYNAGSVFVAPSREDNLPNTVMESLSCGTPVAAFNIGGMPDMIDHKINGYLAKPYDVDDLAQGILWLLNCPDTSEMTQASRGKILDKFNYDLIAKSYLKYYQSIFYAE
jgi:glycosyltransferase involved in cell wall biosynthesis